MWNLSRPVVVGAAVAAALGLSGCRRSEPKSEPPKPRLVLEPAPHPIDDREGIQPLPEPPRPEAPEPAAATEASARPAPAAEPRPPPEPPPPPQAPEGVVARGASRSVELSWPEPPGATRPRGYEVLRGDRVVARTATRTARETGLDNGREYCFTVRSFDAAGRFSEPSAPACAMAWEKEKPPAPTEVLAAAASATEVTVSWRGVPPEMAAGGYEVRGGESPVRASASGVRVGGLAPQRRYCFTVLSLSAAGGRGEPSEPACAQTLADVTPPSAPSGLVAEGRADGIELRWSPSGDDVGVTGYEVLLGERVAATVRVPSASEAGLRPGEHCYRVRALDAAGNRSAPSEPACARAADVRAPSVPAAVKVTARSESEVALAWEASADDGGVARYEVRRDGELVANPERPAAREGGLQVARRYCYTVVAADTAGNRSAPSEPACVTMPDQTPPARPAPVSVQALPGDRVEVRWTATSDNVEVTGYEVWRGKERVASMGVEPRAWTDVGPKPAVDSCYAVRALDAAGNASALSPHACVRTPDETAPSPPAGVAAAPVSSTRVEVSWAASTDNVGVTGYELFSEGRQVAETSRTRAVLSGLEAGRETCVTVRAVDGAGNRSLPSEPACFRPADPSVPVAPFNLVAERVGADEVRLRWDPSPERDVVYVVYWDGGKVGSSSARTRSLGTTPHASFKVFGPPAREQRCYRVTAKVASRESGETLPACPAAGPVVTARP